MNKNSVGLVKAKLAQFTKPLKLTSGKKLPSYELAYETYGKLNVKKIMQYLYVMHCLATIMLQDVIKKTINTLAGGITSLALGGHLIPIASLSSV